MNATERDEWGMDEAELTAEHDAVKRGLPFFKIQEGNNILRVLPAPRGAASRNPFHKVWVHEVNSGTPAYRSFQCPQEMLGQSCPACERVSTMYRSGSEVDRELANKMRAKLEVYANVIDMRNPDKGLQVLRAKEGTYRELLAIMKGDEKAGEPGVNFAHPEKGVNVIIERQGTGKLTKYKTRLGTSGPRPLADMAVLDKMHDLTKAARALSAEQVVAILEGRKEQEALPPPGDEDDVPISGGTKPQTIADDPDLA